MDIIDSLGGTVSDSREGETRAGSEMPESLQRLWAGDVSRRKSSRQALSVDRVVRAAIKVADAEGLSALSMSRVAEELGFTTMALYRHVASKDELLELMFDFVASDPPHDVANAETWRVGLERWAWAALGMFRAHPWMSQIPISGPPRGPYQLAWLEAALQALRDVGLNSFERFGVVLLLSSHVRGEAVLSFQLTQGQEWTHEDWLASEQAWFRQVVSVADPQRYPELVAILTADDSPTPDDYPEQDPDFTFGLARILDGVEVLIRQRTGKGN